MGSIAVRSRTPLAGPCFHPRRSCAPGPGWCDDAGVHSVQPGIQTQRAPYRLIAVSRSIIICIASVFLADSTALVEDGRETSFFARASHLSADVERAVLIGAGPDIVVEDVLTWPPVMFVKRGTPSVLVMIRPEDIVRVTTTVEPAGGDKVPFALRILLKGY